VSRYTLSIQQFLKSYGYGSDDIDGITPLIFSAVFDKKDVARVLIECGADVQKKDDLGRSPLRWSK